MISLFHPRLNQNFNVLLFFLPLIHSFVRSFNHSSVCSFRILYTIFRFFLLSLLFSFYYVSFMIPSFVSIFILKRKRRQKISIHLKMFSLCFRFFHIFSHFILTHCSIFVIYFGMDFNRTHRICLLCNESRTNAEK